MISSFPEDIISLDKPTGLANRCLHASILVSFLLHGIALLLLCSFRTESDAPKPHIKKNIYITLTSPAIVAPTKGQSQRPPDKVNLKTIEAKPPSSEANSASSPSNAEETPTLPPPLQVQQPPLQEQPPARKLTAAPIKERKFSTDHSMLNSACTPLQRQSSIHRCSEVNNEKWQEVNTDNYQGAFIEAFQNLDQRSEFQKDQQKMIQLISAQEAIYALVESTDNETEIQKKEQLRISLEIDKLLDKNQKLMELIGVR